MGSSCWLKQGMPRRPDGVIHPASSFTRGVIMASVHNVPHWPSRRGSQRVGRTATATRILSATELRRHDESLMSRKTDPACHRILVIDDDAALAQDLRKLLAGPPESKTVPAPVQPRLSGGTEVARTAFQIEAARSGSDAFTRAVRAIAHARPYAMVFVSARRLPGGDVVRTVGRLWRADAHLQFALVGAHAFVAREFLARRLGSADRLLALGEPLSSTAIRHIEGVLAAKWRTGAPAASWIDPVEQRADALDEANILAINGPVVFYRLRGEPALPLLEISHDIIRFGHDRDAVLASPAGLPGLVDPRDWPEVEAVMARVLDRRVTQATVEFRLRTGDGNCRWVENRFIPVRDADGRLIEVEGLMLDLTGKRAAEASVVSLAGTDVLTGLIDGVAFAHRVRHAIAAAGRGAIPFAVLHLGLDHFGSVNDTLGRPVGDRLLQEVAKRLTACAGERDLVARVGDDEFAVLQAEASEPVDAGVLAQRIRTALAAAWYFGGSEVRMTASIGVCPYVQGSGGAQEMLGLADLALQRARRTGGNRYCFPSGELDETVRERMTLAEEICGAADRGELELHYQPEVELSSGNIIGMEALVRWHHPTRGELAPDDFMPVAEHAGHMATLGHWVLEQACRQMRAWRDEGIAPLMVTVNLSWCELLRGEAFVRDVAGTIAKWRLAASDLEFDVTEATLTRLTWAHNNVLSALRKLGVKIAIDGFGDEFATFDYVRNCEVNHLKIARSVVQRLASDPAGAATIQAIVNLAREAGMGVIAQGVETEQQRLFLADTNRATKAQGFHFSRAVSGAQAGALLRQGHITESSRR